ESVDDGLFFHPVDKKHRLYAALSTARIGLPVPSGPSTLLRAIETQERAKNMPVVHGRRFVQEFPFPQMPVASSPLERGSLAEVHFKLLERLAPPSVIVNAEHDIVHLSENAGRFLKMSGGEPSANLLRLVDPLVRVELRGALYRCVESGLPVSVIVPIQKDGE